jgi:hypothetical protein
MSALSECPGEHDRTFYSFTNYAFAICERYAEMICLLSPSVLVSMTGLFNPSQITRYFYFSLNVGRGRILYLNIAICERYDKMIHLLSPSVLVSMTGLFNPSQITRYF